MRSVDGGGSLLLRALLQAAPPNSWGSSSTSSSIMHTTGGALGLLLQQAAAAALATTTAPTLPPAHHARCLSSSTASSDGSSSSTTSSSSSSSSSPHAPLARAVRLPPLEVQQQLDARSFDQLAAEMGQQLAIRNCQGEFRLIALASKAATQEQLGSLLALVKRERLARARLAQLAPCSPYLFNALLRAGARVGLGHEFGLQLLQQAGQLGLFVSRGGCEDVLASAVKARDHVGVVRAWLCAQLYCSDPAWQQPPAWWQLDGSSAAGQQGQQQQQGAKAAAASGGGASARLAWASSSLIRVYAKGLAQWLTGGGVGGEGGGSSSAVTTPEHQAALRAELQGLCDELAARGAAVPASLSAALAGGGGAGGVEKEGMKEEAAPESAASAEGEAAAGSDGAAADSK